MRSRRSTTGQTKSSSSAVSGTAGSRTIVLPVGRESLAQSPQPWIPPYILIRWIRGENDDQKIFGVAYMLEWLRDECEVYLRFILDACFGVIKLPPLQQPRGDGWIIEHLSSVGPDTEAYGAM